MMLTPQTDVAVAQALMALKEERDRAYAYADAAAHPGSAPWKEMRAVYAERDRLRDIVRQALPFIEGSIDGAATICANPELLEQGIKEGGPPKETLQEFVADGRRVIREARAAIGEDRP